MTAQIAQTARTAECLRFASKALNMRQYVGHRYWLAEAARTIGVAPEFVTLYSTDALRNIIARAALAKAGA